MKNHLIIFQKILDGNLSCHFHWPNQYHYNLHMWNRAIHIQLSIAKDFAQFR